MERIRELLSKGIESLSPEELAELDTLNQAEADAILDKADGASDEDLAVLSEIADSVRAVRAEGTRRDDAEAERVAHRDRLAAEIRGADDDEADAQPVGPEDAPTEENAPGRQGADEPSEPDPAKTSQEADPKVPVTASLPIPAAPRRVSVPRPATSAPRATADNGRAALTAAANVPGVQGGAKLDTADRLFAALDSAATLAMTASADFKLPVATSRVVYADDRVLTMDPYMNDVKLNKVVSPDAITASGGICAPVPIRYDLPTVGDSDRPVRDGGMAKFGVQGTRGGIRTMTPPTISDLSNLTTGPVSLWTETNDQNPTSPTTKPVFTIPCTNIETTTRVYAIPMAFRIGNFRDRWDPENVKAFVDLAGVWQARYAEAKLLSTIAAGSKVVTHGQILGSAQDVFTAIRQLVAGIRYRHRIGRDTKFRVIGFEWVMDNIITDLIRKGHGEETDEKLRLNAADEVNAYFAALGVNITWSKDFELGKTVGQNGGPFAGTQGAGTAIGYPSQARFYVFIEGSWLFLDGGELNLGVIRDSSLVGTNDMMMFSETFEGAHYFGVPGESYVYDIDICANGGYPSALDIAPCVSGS